VRTILIGNKFRFRKGSGLFVGKSRSGHFPATFSDGLEYRWKAEAIQLKWCWLILAAIHRFESGDMARLP
jgi:hypothetical protein